MKKYLAKNVTVDYVSGSVIVDGYTLPWHVDDVEIEQAQHRVTAVRVGILTEAAHVYHPLENDLAYIRQIADEHRKELGLL